MESANSLLIRIQLKLVIYTVCLRVTLFFRLTPPSRPNKVGLKCPSARPYVRTSVHKVSLISVKFGMYVAISSPIYNGAGI